MKQIPTKLQHRLTRYSLAAGAAGLAAGAHEADAAIVVYDNGGAGWTIDENDFIVFTSDGNTHTGNPGSGVYFNNLAGFTSAGSTFQAWRQFGALGNGGTLVLPSPLTSGASIPGTESQIGPGAYVRFSYNGVVDNGWTIPGSGYLGLVFDDGGDKLYGWMDITLDAYVPGGGDTIQINRFAVENSPNTPILAGDTVGGAGGGGSAVPEPGTLALLVLGATGLTALRRRET